MDEKYDRQLRVWGIEGQERLQAAHIGLINAGATGTEILKNLVLPGIGHFSIIDSHKVVEADLGCNFFLTFDSLGKSRAAEATALLQELNPASEGHFFSEDPIALIDEQPEFFDSFTLIVVTELPEVALRKLAARMWARKVPLVVARSFGLVGFHRLLVPELTIVDSKPENPPDDLRISDPFPELLQYATSLDMAALDNTEYAHVPWVLLLTRHLVKWRSEHDGNAPQTRDEKDLFKKTVLDLARKRDSENFNEAYAHSLKAWVPYSIPSEVREVLTDDAASSGISVNSDSFWILAAALNEFVKNEGGGQHLPLAGNIPDMTATTVGYITLQQLYQDKAQKDIEALSVHLHKILDRLGRPSSSIDEKEVRHFCRHALTLRLLRTRSLEEEYNPKTARTAYLAAQLADPSSNAAFYLLARAADRFFATHGHFPGDSGEENLESDKIAFKPVVQTLLADHNLITDVLPDDLIDEVCRWGAAELHNIAAVMGGMCSQEIIKVLTRQFLPANNTFCFNGITCSTSVLAL